VKRHVKASSAGSTKRQATGLGRSFRGAFATRGVSGDAEGSGAPSRRSRLALFALALAAFTLLVFAPLSQAKPVVSGFGTNGESKYTLNPAEISGGGRFATDKGPFGVAVNNTGNGGVPIGTVYVADTRFGRIQRFSPSGEFERTWGENVFGRDERVQVSFSKGIISGTYTLSVGATTTGNITCFTSVNVTCSNDPVGNATKIQSALEALPSVGAGNVSVGSAGGLIVIRFTGALAGTDIPPMSINSGGLFGGSVPPVSVSTIENGSGGSFAGYEICTVAASCRESGPDRGSAPITANGGQLKDPRGIAVSQANGHVYVTEQVSSTEGNRRVSEFDADGNFVRAWGWDVVLSGRPGDVPGTKEKQTITPSAGAGGTFTLSFTEGSGTPTTTAPIAAEGSAADVEAALAALGAIGGAGNVDVTGPNGGPWTVEFAGALADRDVAAIAVPSAGLKLSNPVGSNLTCASTTAATTKTFQWLTDGAPSTGPGANTSTYTTVAADAGKTVQCQVFAINANAGSTQVSNPTNIVSPRPATDPPVAPATISAPAPANPVVGSTETCSPGTWTGSPTFTYRWYKNGVAVPGATSSTYQLVSGDTPAVIQCAVTGTNAGGSVTKVSQNRATSPAPSPAAPPNNTGSPVVTVPALTVTAATNVTGKPGGFEICTAIADCKRAAVAGAEGGRFGDAIGNPIVDASGNVWVSDPPNRRIQEFDSSGNFLAAYGYNVDKIGGGGALEKCTSAAEGACQAGTQGSGAGQFGANGPGAIAFDSSGNLYAIDPSNNRVQKFDPTFTSATDFGTGTFPAYTSVAPEQLAALQGGSRLVFSVNNAAGERQLLELDLSGNVLDTSLVGLGLTTKDDKTGFDSNEAVNGIAANAATGTLYLTTRAGKSPRRVLLLNATPLPDPVASLDPVTTVGETTATFGGTVDPKGGWVECKFQYSKDQVTWTDVTAPGCNSLAAAGGAQAVSVNATDLSPNSHYFVRLSVSRPLAPGSTKTTLAKAFDTTSPPPLVSNVDAIQIGDTSVRLVGQIDPRNSDTGYVFQYGTTPGLGSSTPPVNVGGGTTPLVVSQLVQGLSPDTTYFFKLVATNLSGATASPSETFTTRQDPLPLPDNRAYEQVTPPDKNFGSVDGGTSPAVTLSLDGDRVGFRTDVSTGDIPPIVGTPDGAPYLSRRTPGGWLAEGVIPPHCFANFGGTSGSGQFGRIKSYSPNLDFAVFFRPESAACTAFPPLDPAAPAPNKNGYIADFNDAPVGYGLLTPAAAAEPPESIASSDDWSHVVYTSWGAQSPGSPVGNFDKIFERDHGTTRLVSVKPDGSPFTTKSLFKKTGADGTNVVSADGRLIFFQNPLGLSDPGCEANDCELYMREDGTTTHWISKQECSSPCSDTQAADDFEWATPDGSKAFFLSVATLTDDDSLSPGKDLYLYTHSANPATDKNLALLSKDNEPADGTFPDVRGMLGLDDNGEVVYFVANSQLIAGQPTEVGAKIYRWRWNGGSPTLEYLATLGPGSQLNSGVSRDTYNWNSPDGASEPQGTPFGRRVTPDGDKLLMQSTARLVPSADYDSDQDVYRWSEQEGWDCISCQQPGVASAGEARADSKPWRDLAQSNPSPKESTEFRLAMSDDGERIFFTAFDALVAADTNGSTDVYEWNQGTVSLVSGGRGSFHSTLIGTTSSGRDVFFTTDEKLVGWDVDHNSDIYDARVGGGLPEPPPTGAPCEGDACRGAGSSAPTPTGAGTAAFQGPGNSHKPARTKPRCPKGKHRVARKGKTRCVKPHNQKASSHRRAAR
jgi:hypothetical protein